MNGYEKYSDDYGGPPPGWGTKALAIICGAVLAGVIGALILG